MESLLPIFFHVLSFYFHDNLFFLTQPNQPPCLEILNVNSQLYSIQVLLFMFCYFVDHIGAVFLVKEALSIEETYTLGNRETLMLVWTL